ncbi:MAG: hypothetical protein HOH33_04370 [Verrucomicrobia bacterium]|jgi:predicted RNA polymerase sigma factor|nr:hypothetical protein [Verrucomicrobiota bacterium]
MEILRQRANRRRILDQYLPNELDLQEVDPERFQPNEVHDDLLRMLFVCSDDSIPVESQLVLGLKILCGFDIQEIGFRLFTTEANVYKRLGRA